MKFEFPRLIFEKGSNTKFHQTPSTKVELLNADGRTDMTKLIVAFRNFANAPQTAAEYLAKNIMCV
jgi:hypothetical protein